MSASTMTITPIMMQDWFDCPKRFWFKYIREGDKSPPILSQMWERCVLTTLLEACHRIAKGEEPFKLRQMVAFLMQQYDENVDRLEKVPRLRTMETYIARATTICQEFLERDAKVMTPTDARLICHAKVSNLARNNSHTVTAPVHVLEKNQIGIIKVSQYHEKQSRAVASPLLVLASIASGIDHYWFLSVSVRGGACFSKYYGYISDNMKRWYEQVVRELAPLMANGPYAPCNPGVYHCSRKYCQFFPDCRAHYFVKGRN